MIVVAPVCFFSSHKKPKRNATKNKNKMPQKAKTECHKKQKRSCQFTSVSITNSLHILYCIVNREGMLYVITFIDKCQSLVLRQIIICKGVADRELFSKRTDTGNIIGYSILFFPAHIRFVIFYLPTKV